MSGPAVVLDACTLIPYRLATTLLWLAEAGFYHPLWSNEILSEVEQNLIAKLGVPAAKAARRVGHMRDGFGAEALVNGFEDRVASMTCDPKDRHVLAAAVHGEAEIIVTSNLKDFPDRSVDPHGIVVVHPDTFLCQLLAGRPRTVLSILDQETAALRRPPQTLTEFLAGLAGAAPTFANLAADASSDRTDDYADVPALVGIDDQTALAAFGEKGDWTNPAQVAFAWWCALLHGDDLRTVKSLTSNPRAFGDFRWAIDEIAGTSLASRVIPAIDAPEDIAFMRFIPEVAQTSQVFAPYTATMTFMTLIKVTEGEWKVWGLGPGLVPTHEMRRD